MAPTDPTGKGVFYALASDEPFVRRVGSVHFRYGTPQVAVAPASDYRRSADGPAPSATP